MCSGPRPATRTVKKKSKPLEENPKTLYENPSLSISFKGRNDLTAAFVPTEGKGEGRVSQKLGRKRGGE